MNSLSPMKNHTDLMQSSSNRPTDHISHIAHEPIHKICSFLTSFDIQSFVCVNKKLSIVGIQAVSYRQTKLFKVFLKFSIEQLRNYPLYRAQRESLAHMMINTQPTDALNLLAVRGFILHLKKELIATLKTTSKEIKFAPLASGKILPFLEDLEEFIDLERRIDEAELIPGEREKVINGLCRELSITGKLDRALELAHTIAEGTRGKVDALLAIAEVLSEQGKTEKVNEILEGAIAVANTTLRPQAKPFVFYAISTAYAKAGNIDQAYHVANMINHSMAKERAIEVILKGAR